MSARDKPELARGARRAEELFDEETDRLVEMSDADFERAMDELPAPARVPSADELLARAKRAAERAAHRNVAAIPARAGRRPWGLWLIAAALGAGVLALVVERREVLAWLRGGEAPIEPDRWEKERSPTPVERADKLRDEAEKACASELWGLCRDKLDEAKRLDPAGDGAPRVQRAREAIVRWTTIPDAGMKDKRFSK